MNLRQLQGEHREWAAYNFPDQLQHDALLGAIEELGELAHAHLKFQQGIRGMTKAGYMAAATDAIGDLVIYLASYCNANGLDLDWCVSNTWIQVKKRDWKKDPVHG